MAKKLSGQTLFFNNPPQIASSGSIVGPEEGKGPLADKFDLVLEDPKNGQKTWEKGERQMVADIIELTMGKASINSSDIDMILGGDLLDQLVTSNYIARDFNIPYLGIYGACSTAVEGLALSALLMDGGYADCVMSYSSSHYQTVERQFRKPLEYGVQYPPEKQWTVTGAGAYILGWKGGHTWITHSTFGKVIDLGTKNPSSMGAAMAPAAADTLLQHFQDLNRGPQDYDLILTGDLARVGSKIFNTLLQEKNINLKDKHQDCGSLIFGDNQKYGAGGSGCAASATVLAGSIIPELKKGNLSRTLIIGTGVLLNPLIIKQNESIPAIAHAVVIEKIPEGA